MRKYFVSFVATNINGIGCVVIEREAPIVDIDDIKDLIGDIQATPDCTLENIVIINWRPMELPE